MNSPKATKERRLHSHQKQIGRLDKTLARLEGVNRRLSTGRLAIVIVGLLLTTIALSYATRQLSAALFFVAFAAFIGLVVRHRRLRGSIQRFTILRSLKQDRVARMQLAWDKLPAALVVPNRERSALEVDFDLVGEHSLHRLLDTCVSAESSQRLRSWLNVGRGNSAEIDHRQTLIRELTPLHYFRDKLQLNARLVNSKNKRWDSNHLNEWLHREDGDGLQMWLIPSVVLAILNTILYLLAQFDFIGDWWLLSLFAYAATNIFAMRHTGQAFSDASYLRDNLEALQTIFDHLESFRYRNKPALKALCQVFTNNDDASTRPSVQLRRVVRVLGGMGITMGNPIVAMLLHLLFPWHILLTLQLNRVKQSLTEQMPLWLDAWFELEALSAFANFAYLNPNYHFPEQAAKTGDPFAATHLGHPLIDDAAKIRNSCTSGAVGRVNLITGSNMAGKSTYLRTIGINLILAYAGSVVDAAHFSFVPARLASCIRVSDSIADGFSYFYAEVRCLKAILDALEAPTPQPLIFFIDEIFRGTNNRERLIGGQALIQAMAGQNGVGLLSTHDLELVQLADNNNQLANYHFREEVIDGQMVFDYLLRDGPCPTTNALRIMALAGLPITLTEQPI
ncbi:MAG: MutS-related protein [Candidatus Promineifilaceae bacterium]